MGTWRLAEPRDLPELALLGRKQQKLTGQKVDEVNYFAPPVLLTLVYEEDGKIRGGFYVEAVGELCFIGTDPAVTEAAPEIAEQVYINLRLRSIRYLRTFIPKRVLRPLKKHLLRAGFDLFEEHAHFFRRLVGDEGEANGAKRDKSESERSN